MKIKKILLVSAIIIPLIFLYFIIKPKSQPAEEAETFELVPPAKALELDRVQKIAITDNSTFGDLMTNAGLAYSQAMNIYEEAKPVYDLARLRAGRFIEMIYDKDTEELKKIIYQIDTEEELHIKKNILLNTDTSTSTQENSPKWLAKKIVIPYEIKTKIADATVETSMYRAALDNGIDERAVIEMANAFQWTIDFAMDPRQGDEFKLIYEERYLNGEYIMPGKFFAGKYVNEGKEFFVYYFEEDKDNKGYFDQDANSVQKMFLKSPLEFKYISSGFTTGIRCLEALHLCSTHRAIDYAANCGTPIRSVGDGTVTFAGWNRQGYGNLITIRHNGTYSTNYAHLSRFAVKRGQKVEQGQTIGYVGTTGLSTGCHLHFEIVKNGIKVDPQKEILPPGEPIKKENLDRFYDEIKNWQDQLEK